MNRYMVAFFLVFLCFGVGTSISLGQTGKKKEEPKSPFSLLNGQVLKIGFNGEDLVYQKRVLVGKDGRPPKVISNPVTQTYTVMVPFKELVEGKEVTKYRPETRTRIVRVTKVVSGEYKMKPTSLGKGVAYFSTDGKQLTKEQVIKKIGMKQATILILQDGQKITPSFQSVLKDDVLIVRSNRLIAEAYQSGQ